MSMSVQNNDNCSRSSSLSSLSFLIPLAGSLAGICTILSVYILARPHLPPGIVTPPISLLGCQSPEHQVYQVGFAITGGLLCQSLAGLWRRHLEGEIRQSTLWGAYLMWWGGIMAVIGVTGQGLVTLHHDFFVNIKKGQIGLTVQDRVHQRMAMVFFLGAAIHTYTTLWYAYYHNHNHAVVNHPTLTDVPSAPTTTITTTQTTPLFSTTSVRIKTICVLLSIVSWPIAEVYHPSRLQEQTQHGNKRLVNVIGVTQYIAVAAYIIFFGSYSLDVWNLWKATTGITQRGNYAIAGRTAVRTTTTGSCSGTDKEPLIAVNTTMALMTTKKRTFFLNDHCHKPHDNSKTE